jgi:predicted DNA-binding protein
MFVKLSQSAEERLARLARHRGLSKISYARRVILQHIEDEEDIRETERILRRVNAGKEETHSLEEVARRLGLDS